MATMMVPVYGEIHIPSWVLDLDSFRRWVHSGVLPEKLKVHFIQGEVWMDFLMEELHTHNQVKAALYRTLTAIVEDEELGLFVPEGMLVSNDIAELGTEPDGMFVSYDSFDSGRVRQRAGKTTGATSTELVGSPDLVIEVVSPSSEDKDTEKLMSQYHDAEIPEYWLVDARGGETQFDIYRHGPKGFIAARKQDNWVKSRVFERHFRLTRTEQKRGYPRFKLEVR